MMKTTKEREHDENLLRANEQIVKREDRLLLLHKLLDAAKQCAELGHFDMSNKLLNEFDDVSKKEL